MNQTPCLRSCLPPLVLIVTITWVVCLCPSIVAGREIFGSVQGSASSEASGFENIRIDSIVIDNRNVYDLKDPRYNRFPFRTANKLHLVTRRSTIERELLFSVGDPFSRDLAEETARNLRTRLALYDAWVETESLPDGRLLIRIVTIDQWSLIIFARLSRDGNLTNIRFGFEERNLLGRGQLLWWEYFIPEGEQNYLSMSYSNPRVFGKTLQTGAAYRTDPKNSLTAFSLSHPFYNLLQAFSWYTSLEFEKTRRDDPAYDLRHHSKTNRSALGATNRTGTYHLKMLTSVNYEYRSSETYTTSFALPDSIVARPFDSIYHQVTIGTGLQTIDYTKMKRINGFNYTEDIEVGSTAKIDLGRAFARRWDTYLFDQLAFEASTVRKVGSNLLLMSYKRTLWFLKEGSTLRSADMGLRFYQTNLKYVTLAFNTRFRTDKRDATLYLGGASGIRGYDKNYAGGRRLFVTNTELRLFPGIDILSVQFGGVLFVDAGRIYKSTERFSVKNLIVSAGAGLRISFERTARSEMARIDFARTRVIKDGRPQSVWQISIGHGQYF